MYVDEAFQRRGIGRTILKELVRLAEAHGFHVVIARIAGDNNASVALHTACGFEMVGVEHEVGGSSAAGWTSSAWNGSCDGPLR